MEEDAATPPPDVWLVVVGRPGAISGECCCRNRRGSLDYAPLNRLADGLGSPADVELAVDGVRMELDRSLGGMELVRDFLIAQSARHQHQDIALARRKLLFHRVASQNVADTVEQLAGHHRLQQRPAGIDHTNGSKDVVARCALEKIAGGTGLNRLKYALVGIVGGENDNPGAGVESAD